VTELRQKVETTVTSRGLLPAGEPLLAAVSGGLDSMVLLHLLHDLSATHRWPLVVAHFNHRLRGQESDEDEAFVRATARQMHLKFKTGQADVRALARRSGISIEMAARQSRHQFLARTARSLGIRRIVLAHHADDQVELFLLRLLRGAGPEGLRGMKFAGASPADPQLLVIRPFLEQTRGELESFARQAAIPFRLDASNHELEFLRNRIRLELLPLLRSSYQPAVTKTLLRLIVLLGAESDLAGELTEQARADPAARFEELPAAIQRRWLRGECLQLGINPSFDLVEHLRSAPEQQIMVERFQTVWRTTAGQVKSRRLEKLEFRQHCELVDLSKPPFHRLFAGLSLSWTVRCPPDLPTSFKDHPPGCERFDADKVGSPVCLRHWQPGDRFQPIGLNASAKVQDLLTNAKVPPARRRELVVATTSQGDVFWIEGLRISERFKLDSAARRCLEWCWDGTRHAPTSPDAPSDHPE
jgi:tRNA(Ile)-lysidine synthase